MIETNYIWYNLKKMAVQIGQPFFVRINYQKNISYILPSKMRPLVID
jgi:hypothetical protein